MPNKAHRAASRQAQVKRRRRRDKTRSQEFDAGPDESAVVATVAEPVVEADVEPESLSGEYLEGKILQRQLAIEISCPEIAEQPVPPPRIR